MGINQIWAGYKRFRYEGPVIDLETGEVLKDEWSSNINVKSGSDPLINISHQFKMRQHIDRNVELILPGLLMEVNI